jgi:hypothetical protein
MQTNLKNNTENTSVSVLMINAQGIMISVQGYDYFLSYNRVPWMQDAPVPTATAQKAWAVAFSALRAVRGILRQAGIFR